jgi:hypothetical protein
MSAGSIVSVSGLGLNQVLTGSRLSELNRMKASLEKLFSTDGNIVTGHKNRELKQNNLKLLMISTNFSCKILSLLDKGVVDMGMFFIVTFPGHTIVTENSVNNLGTIPLLDLIFVIGSCSI